MSSWGIKLDVTGNYAILCTYKHNGAKKMINKDVVLRSNTGKYHMGFQNASSCNGRTGRYLEASTIMIENASEGSFCKKCFFNGKQGAMEHR